MKKKLNRGAFSTDLDIKPFANLPGFVGTPVASVGDEGHWHLEMTVRTLQFLHRFFGRV